MVDPFVESTLMLSPPSSLPKQSGCAPSSSYCRSVLRAGRSSERGSLCWCGNGRDVATHFHFHPWIPGTTVGA